ncbi:hypothetical protein H8E77_18240 [bacterium]|nr:hypothetical protein [bacterium]
MHTWDMIKNGIWAFIILASGLFTMSTVQAENSIWWEGEHPVETNFPKETWFSESTFADKRDLLSGGAWLTNADTRTGDEAYAKYNIEVPTDGKYRFLFRFLFGSENRNEYSGCGSSGSTVRSAGGSTRMTGASVPGMCNLRIRWKFANSWS